MQPFIGLDPFNQANWIEVSGNTRRVLDSSQKGILQVVGANPSVIPVGWFLALPVATG